MEREVGGGIGMGNTCKSMADSFQCMTKPSTKKKKKKKKVEPAFNSLQGNLAFIRVRASRCPFHLRHQSQHPSHIPITERSLLLRCFCKVGIPLQSKPGNQLSSQDDLWYPEMFSSCCAELGVPLDLGRCSRGISGVA